MEQQVAVPDGSRITVFRDASSHQRPPRVSLAFDQEACLMKDQPDRRVPPITAWLLWGGLRTAMWWCAIIGPLLVVAGVASYLVDLSSFLPVPGPESLRFGIAMSGVGITFVWLRMRRYIRFAGDLCE